MTSPYRDILVLLKGVTITESELEELYRVLQSAESPEKFCIAHELVNRNRITSNHKKILKESRHFSMRPFRFLINKN